jgi:presqualene diphosphate synthase
MSALTVPGRGELGRLFGARARTFSFASRFLPPERRRAVEALYAFCRTVDDLADEYPLAVGGPLLDAWWQWVDGLQRGERLGIAMQLTNVLRDVGEDLQKGRAYLTLRTGRWFPPAEARVLAPRREVAAL